MLGKAYENLRLKGSLHKTNKKKETEMGKLSGHFFLRGNNQTLAFGPVKCKIPCEYILLTCHSLTELFKWFTGPEEP